MKRLNIVLSISLFMIPCIVQADDRATFQNNSGQMVVVQTQAKHKKQNKIVHDKSSFIISPGTSYQFKCNGDLEKIIMTSSAGTFSSDGQLQINYVKDHCGSPEGGVLSIDNDNNQLILHTRCTPSTQLQPYQNN